MFLCVITACSVTRHALTLLSVHGRPLCNSCMSSACVDAIRRHHHLPPRLAKPRPTKLVARELGPCVCILASLRGRERYNRNYSSELITEGSSASTSSRGLNKFSKPAVQLYKYTANTTHSHATFMNTSSSGVSINFVLGCATRTTTTSFSPPPLLYLP